MPVPFDVCSIDVLRRPDLIQYSILADLSADRCKATCIYRYIVPSHADTLGFAETSEASCIYISIQFYRHMQIVAQTLADNHVDISRSYVCTQLCNVGGDRVSTLV